MKYTLILTMVFVLTGCATMRDSTSNVALEFRLGSDSPAPGLTRMAVPGSKKPVYISKDVVLSNADVRDVRVSTGPNGPQIEIVFTNTGAEQFALLTVNNIGKPFAILVDGQLISAPIIMDKIFGGKAVIAGDFSPEEAKRIADGITGQ